MVVGNYNLPNDGFPYGLLYRGDVAGNGTYTKIDPASYTYYEIPKSLVNGAISMTAYGIWYNPERQNYTNVGGFKEAPAIRCVAGA